MLFSTIVNSRTAGLIKLGSLLIYSVRHNMLWVCAMLCALPGLAEAVQIGDLISVSKLGEPLRVEVGFTSANNEKIDNSCISLVAPDSKEDDAINYLRDTKLSVQDSDNQQLILLSSFKPFNDIFAKFKLQVHCSGQGSIAKTFTILLDIFDTTKLPEHNAPTNELQAAPQAKSDPQSSDNLKQASLSMEPPVVTPPSVKPPSTRSARTKHTTPNSSRHGLPRHAHSSTKVSFKLKISGEPLDASRIGKINAEERTFLLASQKLLDADDHMASILTLQNQVKQLQEDLTDMRTKLTELGLSAHVDTSKETVPVELTGNTPPPVEGASTSVEIADMQTDTDQKPAEEHQSNWKTWGWQFGLLGLAIISMTWVLRHYARRKSAASPLQIYSDNIQIHTSPTIVPMATTQSATSGDTTIKMKSKAQTVVDAKTYSPQSMPAASQIIGDQNELNAIIEEAQLYAAFNHPQRAVKILLELLVDNPKKSDAWLLLLAILASLNNALEFENNARAFLRHNPQDTENWKTIQVLGRTLSHSNPLYRDSAPVLSPDTVLGERHLLGDVLVDLEMISPESLHHCLAHFESKKHGRLGVYLVTEKVITHKQLTEALVHQNTLNQGTPYVAQLT